MPSSCLVFSCMVILFFHMTFFLHCQTFYPFMAMTFMLIFFFLSTYVAFFHVFIGYGFYSCVLWLWLLFMTFSFMSMTFVHDFVFYGFCAWLFLFTFVLYVQDYATHTSRECTNPTLGYCRSRISKPCCCSIIPCLVLLRVCLVRKSYILALDLLYLIL